MCKIQPTEHDKIVRLYAKMGAAKIGQIYNVSHQAILNILRDKGVKIRPVGFNVNGAKNGRSRKT